jgi:hypothetical protein
MPTLQLGSRDLKVQLLRTILNQVVFPCPNLSPGQTFDYSTCGAVIRFQQRKRITPNGVVDQETWSALMEDWYWMTLMQAWNDARTPPPQTYSFEDRVAKFVADAEKTYQVQIPLGNQFRPPEVAQKWHIAHMIRYNSFPKTKPAQSQVIGGRNLIAWSHLSDPLLVWEHVRWEDFLRDANGNVPIKQGNAWATDHAPDEEQTRRQAFNILNATSIQRDKFRPTEPHSAMVAPGYEGCAEPCKCGDHRSRHIAGAARDLGRAQMALLEKRLWQRNGETLDDYLGSYGLYRPMNSEPWHVEMKQP